jgi:hypothetical protein
MLVGREEVGRLEGSKVDLILIFAGNSGSMMNMIYPSPFYTYTSLHDSNYHLHEIATNRPDINTQRYKCDKNQKAFNCDTNVFDFLFGYT